MQRSAGKTGNRLVLVIGNIRIIVQFALDVEAVVGHVKAKLAISTVRILILVNLLEPTPLEKYPGWSAFRSIWCGAVIGPALAAPRNERGRQPGGLTSWALPKPQSQHFRLCAAGFSYSVGKQTFAGLGPTCLAQSPPTSWENRNRCTADPDFVCLACFRLGSGGSTTLSVTGRCHDGPVITATMAPRPTWRCSILLTSKI
jgi:hypothetical protein